MLPQILNPSMQGITLIEEDIGAVSPLLARQIGTYATTMGKKVCFLALQEVTEPIPQRVLVGSSGESRQSDLIEENTVALKAGRGLLNLEDLKFDLIVFESFSSHLFDRTDSEIVEMLGEMRRLASNGRSFILTSESEMLSSRVNAYLRAMSDNIFIIKTEVNRDKIERLLYIPKIKGMKPMDKLVKFTVEDNGIEIDTREFVG